MPRDSGLAAGASWASMQGRALSWTFLAQQEVSKAGPSGVSRIVPGPTLEHSFGRVSACPEGLVRYRVVILRRGCIVSRRQRRGVTARVRPV